MEKENTKKKQKNKRKEDCGKRSPLQELGGHLIHKTNTKKIASNASSSAVVSVEAPKGCFRFLLSANLSSSSSSSTTLLDKKPISFSKLSKNATPRSALGPSTSKVLHRSKDNALPKKPFSEKFKIKQPPCLHQWQSGKNNRTPTFKNSQRSKLSSVQINPVNKLKRRSEEFEKRTKNSSENDSGKPHIDPYYIFKINNLDYVDSCTPVGKITSCNLDCDDDRSLGEDPMASMSNRNCVTALKTPPVEASVSPEIQCGTNAKMLVSTEAATPVCYGAGHLVSGVTDKRKCRSRGILIGGCEKTNLFSDEKNDRNVVNESLASSIHLPNEASVHWLLSPCDEVYEDERSDSGHWLDQSPVTSGNASGTLDSLSSPSTLRGNANYYSVSGSCCHGCGSSVGVMANKSKTRIVVLSPKKTPESHGFLGTPNNAVEVHLLAATLHLMPSKEGVSSREGKNYRCNMTGDDSALSISSISSGNIIQTPSTDSSSYRHAGRTKVEVHQKNFLHSELDLITETLKSVRLSPKSEMSMQDAHLGLHIEGMASPSDSAKLSQIQKNVDNASSWTSDCILDNLALSQMRISWRDGLVSRIVEVDEFDCCRCLSDEEIDTDQCSDEQLVLYPHTQFSTTKAMDTGLRSYLATESNAIAESNLGIDSDPFTRVLDYNPIISARKREKMIPDRRHMCAESICTNRSDFVTSADSDWTSCFENHLFQD